MPNQEDTGSQDERRFVRRPADGARGQTPAPAGGGTPSRPAPPPRAPQPAGSGQAPTPAAPQRPAPTEADRFDRDVKALASRVTNLEKSAQLSNVHSAVQRISTTLDGLPTAIQALRSQGYLYGNILEGQAESLAQQWEPVRRDVLRQAQSESGSLALEVRSVTNRVQTLQTSFAQSAVAARSLYPAAVTAVDGLEAKIRGAESRLGALYSGLNQQANALKRQVDQLAAMLKEFQTATFGLQPGESPINTTQATYLRNKDEGPKGIFYLTNQRVLFEQKEEVATRRVLFITTARELVHRLLLDQPVGYVQRIEGIDRGFGVFRKEMLTLHFAPEAGVGVVHLQLREDSTTWQALLRRVMAGEMELERLGAKPEDVTARAAAEQETARQLPTSCPTCGAPLGQRVVRGVVSLSCDFCGAAIRV